MIILGLIGLTIVVLLVKNKPKKVAPQCKKIRKIYEIKREIDAEYSHFNNLSSQDFERIDVSCGMLLAKENELNLQIRRARL